MKELGKVVNLQNKNAMIMFERTSACKSCRACGMGRRENSITITVENILNAQVGNWVEIEIVVKKALKASAFAYIFPLIMLIAGIIAGYYLNNLLNIFESEEIFAAICGIIFTIASFFIIKLAEPRFIKKFKNVYKMISIRN